MTIQFTLRFPATLLTNQNSCKNKKVGTFFLGESMRGPARSEAFGNFTVDSVDRWAQNNYFCTVLEKCNIFCPTPPDVHPKKKEV